MKRQAEYLVEKRDGRTEWLRATKLARSIHLAMINAGMDEDWLAMDVAYAVLSGVRARRRNHEALGRRIEMLRTAELADAVQQVLVATGSPTAAASYGAVAAERGRRRRSLELLAARSPGAGTDTLPPRVTHDRIGRG